VKSDPDKNRSSLAQTRSRKTLSAEAEALITKLSREVPECLRSYRAQAVTMHRMKKYSFKRTQVAVVPEPIQACLAVQTKMKRYSFKRQPVSAECPRPKISKYKHLYMQACRGQKKRLFFFIYGRMDFNSVTKAVQKRGSDI